MNQLVNMQALTMSSREIADLAKASHDNVLKTIRALIEAGVVSRNDTPYIPYTHPQNGQVYFEFLLSYRDTMVVVSGYSVELRAKIIDRWQELESKAQEVKPLTHLETARLLVSSLEQIEQQAQQLAIAAPKVEFVDRYVESSGLKGFRQVAKLLGIKENLFRAFLVEHKIQYQIGGDWVPYAVHIDAGRFEVKTGTAKHNDHAFASALFTSRGIEYVARLLRDSKKIEPEKALGREVSA